MSTTRDELAEFLDNLLNPAAFADYGPNGLQIEGAEVIERVQAGVCSYGFRCLGVTESPIRGGKSENIEFLGYFVRDPSVPVVALQTPAEEADEQEEVQQGEPK